MKNQPKKEKAENISLLGRAMFFIMRNSILPPNEIESAEKTGSAILAPVSKEQTLISRALGYSGAATCLLIILGIVQISANSPALKISVMAAAIGLPLWLLSALLYEAYLQLNFSLFPHQRTQLAKRVFASIQITAGLALLLSITCLVYHTYPYAAWALLITIFLSVLLLLFFYFSMICYWIVQMLKEVMNIDIPKRMREIMNTYNKTNKPDEANR